MTTATPTSSPQAPFGDRRTPTPTYTAPVGESRGFSIASLVLGLVSIVASYTFVVPVGRPRARHHGAQARARFAHDGDLGHRAERRDARRRRARRHRLRRSSASRCCRSPSSDRPIRSPGRASDAGGAALPRASTRLGSTWMRRSRIPPEPHTSRATSRAPEAMEPISCRRPSTHPPNAASGRVSTSPSPVRRRARETDSLGTVEIPADAYWGIHTARALENFPISKRPDLGLPRPRRRARDGQAGLRARQPRDRRARRREGRPDRPRLRSASSTASSTTSSSSASSRAAPAPRRT